MSAQPNPKLLDAVLHRASLDSSFRTQLLADPAGAIHDAFGTRLPEGFRIRFVEKDAGIDLLVVLPELRESDELTEDDLEAVAGGNGPTYEWSDGGSTAPPTSDPPPAP